MPACPRISLVAFASSWLLGCVPGEPAIHAGQPPPAVVTPSAPDERPADAAVTTGGQPRPSDSHPMGRTVKAAPLLAALPVRSPAARAGYAREQFGHAWLDVDRNGCDTRDDILRRDLQDVRLEPGKRPCVVTAGELADPYTAAKIAFERGGGASVDIDHVVALGDAWVTGAAGWEPSRRVALANDPLNLLAVAASANRAKGSNNAAAWLPENLAYRCAYVARQIAVKAKYGLWITEDEREAMKAVLRDCPDEVAPAGGGPIDAPPVAERPRAPAKPREAAERPAAPAKPAPAPSRSVDPDYGSCKEAKRHGAGPYRRGVDPEYAYYRDADGDGVVCE
ncbi:GmrSD restriction endonuclease domain-containing protein [Nannocystis punicea]|uniref:DUF1524 domain-containing protein n=1 Tax=Nannocystis punicea TaxID=2995304 RepID=A0ABY7GUW7_9BACT|nr:DUF1524 domain-containing protein [Nannocystis poenicansa]WAS90762.1 DUF1524 domain-containing protein [Nannocystis poenicansa]